MDKTNTDCTAKPNTMNSDDENYLKMVVGTKMWLLSIAVLDMY